LIVASDIQLPINILVLLSYANTIK
jgi:hypothetical protein